MPRRAKPPMLDLMIKGLSAVDAPQTVDTFPDDFSDAILPMSPDAVVAQAPAKVLNQTNLRKYHREQKLARKRAFAQSYCEQRDKAIELIKQRMQSTTRLPTKPGEQAIALGSELVIVMPAKPWRRL